MDPSGFFLFLRPSDAIAPRYWRLVYLTNALTFLLSLLTFGLLGILIFLFGWTLTTGYVLLVAVLFLLVIVVNRINHHVGRLAFCLIPVYLTFFITLYSKLEGPPFTYIIYFDSRFILLATTILPLLVFRLEERWQLIFCLLSTLITLLLFDPVHELLGVGFFQKGFAVRSYYYINYIIAISLLILLFGIFMLRSIMERAEFNLNKQNEELHAKQREIEVQHAELHNQQSEILTSREKLEEANRVIMRQQKRLEQYNAVLEALVNEKSQELKRANEELVKHNSELLQFSYTVSHNLRGPVARLLGLTRLSMMSADPEDKKQMERLILKSSQELDEVLRDLSLIIDIRNDLYRVKEKVKLADEWEKAKSLLGENLKPYFDLKVDFSGAPFVFGVRPMIQSILFNLLGNAIKYRDPDRNLQVTVLSFLQSDTQTILEVRDNGLGIDLGHQRKNIFKLYKRFHSHVDGKGLGLYLVKTQMEAMGGSVEVESQLNVGTTFRLLFVQPDKVSRQVYYESDVSQVYYDANLKITVINWKMHVNTHEYRQTFQTVLNSLKVYNTQGWIADVRNQGSVPPQDQDWLISTVIPEAVKCGLKRIATLGMDQSERADYAQRLREASDQFAIEMREFSSLQEAMAWMAVSESQVS